MFDIGTIIGINAGVSGYEGSEYESDMDEKKELRELIAMIETARERLDDLMIRYDARDEDTMELEKAVDALEDAVDSIEAVLDEYDE